MIPANKLPNSVETIWIFRQEIIFILYNINGDLFPYWRLIFLFLIPSIWLTLFLYSAVTVTSSNSSTVGNPRIAGSCASLWPFKLDTHRNIIWLAWNINATVKTVDWQPVNEEDIKLSSLKRYVCKAMKLGLAVLSKNREEFKCAVNDYDVPFWRHSKTGGRQPLVWQLLIAKETSLNVSVRSHIEFIFTQISRIRRARIHESKYKSGPRHWSTWDHCLFWGERDSFIYIYNILFIIALFKEGKISAFIGWCRWCSLYIQIGQEIKYFSYAYTCT